VRMTASGRYTAAALLLTLVAGCAMRGGEYAERFGGERGEEGEREREEKVTGALERAQLFAARREPSPNAKLEPTRWFDAEARMRTMPRHYPRGAHGIAKGSAPQWEWLGPANATGRTRTLEFDPRNPDVMYAGGVSGGVWRSTDAGANWQPLSDDAVNLNIGALAIDPARPDTIYAGTGELYRASGMPWSPMAGGGILRSDDGGHSWNALLATQNDNFRYVSDIVVSAHDTRRLYAATNSGVWRSNDGGATFERLLRPADGADQALYEGCTDLALRTDTPGDWLLATCASRSVADRYWLPGTVTPPTCGGPCPAAVFLNTDAGGAGAWETVLSEAGQGRTQMDIHRDGQQIVYAVAASIAPGYDRTGDGVGDYDNGLHALWRSDDGGRTWQARLRNDSPDLMSASLFQFHFAVRATPCQAGDARDFYGAGWYNNAIAVDPVNPERVWVGGMTLFRSDDGGRRFGLASYYDSSDATYVHPDQHRIRFHPNYDGAGNQRVYATNDGGIAQSDNATAPVGTGDAALCAPRAGERVGWRDISRGMGTTQFYAGGAFPDGSGYLGGTQDNGTWLGRDSAGPYAWRHIWGGDGGFVAVDPRNVNVLYATSQYVGLVKSTNGGMTFTNARSGLNDQTLFIMPYVLDPNAPSRLYAGGTRLWRTDNGASNWRAVSTTMGGFDFGVRISAIAIAPSDSERMLVGNRRGIFRNANATASGPTTAWASVSPRDGWVSRLAFDPNDANVAYATYSTFGGVHVWKTADGGASWTPLDGAGDGALPDVPVHAIVVNPANTQELYLGTDLGLFVSIDGGAHWAVENTGFANVITEDLKLATPAGGPPLLFAFTYGRGVWRVPLVGFDGMADYRIDTRVAGMWWNAQQDGHGLMLEPIALDGVVHVVASWFAYRNGAPFWLVGVGKADNDRVSIPMRFSTGANFPPAFLPGDVTTHPWGSIDLQFHSDSAATLAWTSQTHGFTSGSMPITPLLRAASPASDPPSAQIRACHSGNWYDPAQNGHGLFVDVFQIDGVRQLAVAWYVFDGGDPLFLVGAGPIEGDTATLDLAISRGPSFPPDYRASDLVRQRWGSARVRFTGDDTGEFAWNPAVSGYTAGSMPLRRLTAQVGRQCR